MLENWICFEFYPATRVLWAHSRIDVGQGINVWPGKFDKINIITELITSVTSDNTDVS